MYKVRVIVDDPQKSEIIKECASKQEAFSLFLFYLRMLLVLAPAINCPFVATAPDSRMWCVSNRFGVSPAPMVSRCYVAYHLLQRMHKNKAASLDVNTSCDSTSLRVSRCATIEPQNTYTSPRENVSRKCAVGFATFSKSCFIRTIFFATFSKSCVVLFLKGFGCTPFNRGSDKTLPLIIIYPIIFYILLLAFYLNLFACPAWSVLGPMQRYLTL